MEHLGPHPVDRDISRVTDARSRRAASLAVIGLVLLAGVASSGEAASTSTLYGVVSGSLARIDTGTGAATLIGPTAAGELSAHEGRLYGFDSRQQSEVPRLDGVIVRLDPATGATLEKVSSPVKTGTILPPVGMAIRSDGTVFVSTGGNPLVDQGELYNCGVFDTCALVGGFAPGMDGLAFDASDVLYGLSRHRSFEPGEMDISLYTLDPSGPTKPTGLSSEGPGFPEGLAFDPETGILYAGISDRLYTIDVATGAATFIGVTGGGQILGLAFLSPVPEPSVGVLLGGGLAVVAWVSRRLRVGRGDGC